MPEAARAIPLRLPADRFYLWAIGFAVLGLSQIITAVRYGCGDWPTFAYASQHVGTRALLTPAFASDIFPYPPGAAWLLAPVGHLSMVQGYAINALAMTGLAFLATRLATSIYGLRGRFTAALVFAWFPMTEAIFFGQNAPLGLALVLASLYGTIRNSLLLEAVPIGLLLYKPSYALPFIVLLAMRQRWRALAVVAGTAAFWYVASSAAAAQWSWLPAWQAMYARWYPLDFDQNAYKQISLVVLFLRLNLSHALIAAFALIACVLAIPLLRRPDPRIAYGVAGVLPLLLTPHALSYDAVLLLPTIFFLVTMVHEPARSLAIVVMYWLALLSLFVAFLGFNTLLPVVVCAFTAWLFQFGDCNMAPQAGAVARLVLQREAGADEELRFAAADSPPMREL